VQRNSNGPVFSLTNYTFNVEEKFAVGGQIGAVKATDLDGDQLGFTSLATGEAADLFFLNVETGAIVLRDLLTTASLNRYTFDVTVRDFRPASVQRSATAEVTINILRDSGPPVFTSANYEIDVPITRAVNATVLRVVATDPDLKGEIRYRLKGYAPGTDYFTLDIVQGNINVIKSLNDTDVFATYTLLIEAFDTAAPSIIVQAAVKINILRNLNDPLFASGSYEDSVYDYQAVGTQILQVSATDADITRPENEFVFSIASNSPAASYFAINPFSGLITVNGKLADSPISRYTFNVIAKDLGADPRSSLTQVTIVIVRNQATPQFSLPSYNAQTSEKVSVLDSIIKVTATDDDPSDTLNGQIRYSIESQEYFQINPETGDITARVSLITAEQDTYTMTVRATDKGVNPLFSEAIVVITITREGLPFFNQTAYERTVSELLPVGSEIITLTAEDPLLKLLKYEITSGGSSATLFNMDPDTGRIQLAQSLRSPLADDITVYTLSVAGYRAENFNVRAAATVTINVNRNPNAPVFTHGNLEYDITEDAVVGGSIGQVNATDADFGTINGNFSFRIVSANSSPVNSGVYFHINAGTGVIYVSANLRDDLTQPAKYTLSVVVTDKGFPAKSSSILVTVNVVRNRNGPVFSLPSYTLDVDENTISDFQVGTVETTEADNDPVRYTVIGELPGSLYFDVDAVSGEIRTTGLIVRDSTTTYKLLIQAVDVPQALASPRTATAEVIINVLRNPNAPVFINAPYFKEISEYTDLQSSIAQVIATDQDNPNFPSGTIRYYLRVVEYDRDALFAKYGSRDLPNDKPWFVVSETAGSVHLTQLLTQKRIPDMFNLTIEARDKGNPQKSAEARLTIKIVRNLNTPLFATLFGYEATIDNTYNVGQPTGIIASARDADIDNIFNNGTPNALFDYQMDPGDEYAEDRKYFDITQTGILFVKTSLRDSPIRKFDFFIVAIDKSWQPLSDRARVIITVEQRDLGTRELGFQESVLTWNVPEGAATTDIAPLRLALGNVESQIVCTIVEVNGDNNTANRNYPFAVRSIDNGQNCELYIVEVMDREQTGSYNIMVAVEEVTSNGKRKKREVINVSNTHKRVMVMLTIADVNDSPPSFVYPAYPAAVTDQFVFAVSDRATAGAVAGKILATDPDLNSQITYELQPPNSAFYLSSDLDLVLSRSLGDIASGYVTLSVTASDGTNKGFANIIVNVIKDSNRYVMVLDGISPQKAADNVEAIRDLIQRETGKVAIIETFRSKLVQQGNSLRFNSSSTDIYYCLASPTDYKLLPNSVSYPNLLAKVQALIVSTGGVFINQRNPINFETVDLAGLSDEVKSALNIGTQLKLKTKSYIWWTNDPWAAFIAAAGVVFVLALVGIVVLLNSYKRYSRFVSKYKIYQSNMAGAEFTEPPSFLREYETQSLNMYVPPDETVQDLGEINMNFQGDTTTPRGASVVGAGTVVNPVYGKIEERREREGIINEVPY